jgi:hypothetical protein
MTDDLSSPEQPPAPRWQPLPAVDRRVAGVLAEKAKTTPDAYPMSLNAICTACNQKSNRSPMMNLQPEDVEESLSRLRHLGAAGLVEGYGRVSKYRHYLYDWLGVDKVELAVMAELLLRGTQTEGELRGRAARMEPIRDLAELRPVLASLKSKGLVNPCPLPAQGIGDHQDPVWGRAGGGGRRCGRSGRAVRAQWTAVSFAHARGSRQRRCHPSGRARPGGRRGGATAARGTALPGRRVAQRPGGLVHRSPTDRGRVPPSARRARRLNVDLSATCGKTGSRAAPVPSAAQLLDNVQERMNR